MSSKKTPKPVNKPSAPPAAPGDFDALVTSIVHIHQQTQHFAAKAVNVALTLRNWLIGYRIEVYERQGVDRAAYGDKLMDTLARRLVKQGWARCDRRELYRFGQLYLTYPQIVESVTPQWPTAHLELIFRLSFTHLAELIQLADDTQRRFYELECMRGNWSVRELRRQIDSLYYQRSGLSRDKAQLSALAHAAADTLQPAHRSLCPATPWSCRARKTWSGSSRRSAGRWVREHFRLERP